MWLEPLKTLALLKLNMTQSDVVKMSLWKAPREEYRHNALKSMSERWFSSVPNYVQLSLCHSKNPFLSFKSISRYKRDVMLEATTTDDWTCSRQQHRISVRSLTWTDVIPQTWSRCYCRKTSFHHHVYGSMSDFYLWVQLAERNGIRGKSPAQSEYRCCFKEEPFTLQSK